MFLLHKIVETIDFVAERSGFSADLDPALFMSRRSGRGPLKATWLDDLWRSHQQLKRSAAARNGLSLSCGTVLIYYSVHVYPLCDTAIVLVRNNRKLLVLRVVDRSCCLSSCPDLWTFVHIIWRIVRIVSCGCVRVY